MTIINFHPNGIYHTNYPIHNSLQDDLNDYTCFCKHLKHIIDEDDHANLKHIKTVIKNKNFIIMLDYIDEKVVLIFNFPKDSMYQAAWDTMKELNYINN